jgi:outer membrane biosynthesis protein TonB
MPAIQQKEPINYKAAAYTAGIHALLFLLFILLHSSTPIPPPITNVEGGIEVNLGTSDEGSGHDQPMNTKAPAPYQATVVFKSAAVKSNLPKPIMQSDEKDAPEVNNSNKEKKNKPVTVTNEPEHKALPQQKPKYTYAGETGQGGNSAAQNKPGTGEGNDNGHGDKGVPGGTPGAPNYSGTPGNGNGGIGHTLDSREIYPRSFIAEFSESGIGKIHVAIDRKGNIISKRVVSSSSPELSKLALEKLNGVHYSPSTDANPQDFDDITIKFQTRR